MELPPLPLFDSVAPRKAVPCKDGGSGASASVGMAAVLARHADRKAEPAAAEPLKCTLPEAEAKYKPPAWGGKRAWKAGELCKLDVFRAGVALDSIDLKGVSHAVLGRDTRCHIQIEHPSLSRQHCALQVTPAGGLHVQDLASSHGTFVNGQRLTPNTFVQLRAGDIVKLGESSRIYVFEHEGGDGDAGRGRADVDREREETYLAHKMRKESAKTAGNFREKMVKATLNAQQRKEKELAERAAAFHKAAEEGAFESEVARDGEEGDASLKRPATVLERDTNLGFDEEDTFYDRDARSAKKRRTAAPQMVSVFDSTAQVSFTAITKKKPNAAPRDVSSSAPQSSLLTSLTQLTKERDERERVVASLQEKVAAANASQREAVETEDPLRVYLVKNEVAEATQKLKAATKQLETATAALEAKQQHLGYKCPGGEGTAKTAPPTPPPSVPAATPTAVPAVPTTFVVSASSSSGLKHALTDAVRGMSAEAAAEAAAVQLALDQERDAALQARQAEEEEKAMIRELRGIADGSPAVDAQG